jgi:TonB family protein
MSYIVGLPPRIYTFRLDGDREDPYILPSRHARIDQLLVVPDYNSTWRAVAAALAIPCGSATVIERPLIPPPSTYPSSVRLGPVKANGAAGYQNLVRRIVRAHGNEIRWCYDTNRRRDPRIRGRVTIAITIDALGKVTAAAVAESTLGDNDIAECVRTAARRWKFVKPEDGREVEARFTWELSPP